MTEADRGILDVRSHHSVPETIARLESQAVAHGLTIFARIDFSGDAAGVGLSMRPMQMLIFGNPRAGTPLLVAAPRTGLDLPLKALAWADESGGVWISCNSPDYLLARHGFPQPLTANIAGIVRLIEMAAGP